MLSLLNPRESESFYVGGSSSSTSPDPLGEALDAFHNWQNWPVAEKAKPDNGLIQFLYRLMPAPTYTTGGSNNTISQSYKGLESMDVNGDGLMDMAYMEFLTQGYAFGLWLNTGDNGFQIQYKCVISRILYHPDGSFESSIEKVYFYGNDCADVQ